MAFPHENPIISPLHPSSANASASSFHLWSLCPFTCDHRTRQRLDACKYTRALGLKLIHGCSSVPRSNP